MSANMNLHRAKAAKNDEFYTQLSDVSKELEHYKPHFKGKVVYCNCDDQDSAFWKYFHLNFEHLGLKKLIASHYDKTAPSYKLEYEGGNDNDIYAGVKIPLEGDGDFRSQECMELLRLCDMAVTNPPFSLAREYISYLMKYNKAFLIIGDMQWITYKDIFPLIKDNKIWLGNYSVKEFIQPDGSVQKFGNKLWFTNLDHPHRHEKLILRQKYEPEKHPTFINYNAINVKNVTDIPADYNGLMAVPTTFLHYYNPDEFEIVGCPDYNGKYGRDEIGVQRLGEEWLDAYFKNGNTGHYTANMRVLAYYESQGVPKRPFSKIIIRKKTDI